MTKVLDAKTFSQSRAEFELPSCRSDVRLADLQVILPNTAIADYADTAGSWSMIRAISLYSGSTLIDQIQQVDQYMSIKNRKSTNPTYVNDVLNGTSAGYEVTTTYPEDSWTTGGVAAKIGKSKNNSLRSLLDLQSALPVLSAIGIFTDKFPKPRLVLELQVPVVNYANSPIASVAKGATTKFNTSTSLGLAVGDKVSFQGWPSTAGDIGVKLTGLGVVAITAVTSKSFTIATDTSGDTVSSIGTFKIFSTATAPTISRPTMILDMPDLNNSNHLSNLNHRGDKLHDPRTSITFPSIVTESMNVPAISGDGPQTVQQRFRSVNGMTASSVVFAKSASSLSDPAYGTYQSPAMYGEILSTTLNGKTQLRQDTPARQKMSLLQTGNYITAPGVSELSNLPIYTNGGNKYSYLGEKLGENINSYDVSYTRSVYPDTGDYGDVSLNKISKSNIGLTAFFTVGKMMNLTNGLVVM